MKVPTALGARIPRLRRADSGFQGVEGPVRADRRTRALLRRLRPGDIAVIDHLDLDRVTAETLVSRKVAAVLNATASISGRYPTLGARRIVEAGIPLVDRVGTDVFAQVREGERLRVDGSALYRDDHILAAGSAQTTETVDAALAAARTGLGPQLEAFAASSVEYLRREHELLIDGIGVPAVNTAMTGRHALVVMRGPHHREDLAALRHYIRDFRPVLIGVDGGADALLEAGHRPALIAGDLESVSDEALTSGAELVVRGHRDGRVPGLARVRGLGRDAEVFATSGTGEDAALMLAAEAGASLIVVAGSHACLDELFDKGRAGMAGGYLTRMRIGGRVVDAQGAAQLYRSRISPWTLVALAMAALLAIVAAVAVTSGGEGALAQVASRYDVVRLWFVGMSP